MNIDQYNELCNLVDHYFSETAVNKPTPAQTARYNELLKLYKNQSRFV